VLKIHQVFILKFLLLIIGTLFVTSLISYVALKSVIIDYNKNHLQNVLVLMGLELKNIDNLESYASKIKKNTDLRVTIIDAHGVVIAESNIDKNIMDNHADRYEIKEASQDMFAHIVRYSKT
jgi:hypothetical protein